MTPKKHENSSQAISSQKNLTETKKTHLIFNGTGAVWLKKYSRWCGFEDYNDNEQYYDDDNYENNDYDDDNSKNDDDDNDGDHLQSSGTTSKE